MSHHDVNVTLQDSAFPDALASHQQWDVISRSLPELTSCHWCDAILKSVFPLNAVSEPAGNGEGSWEILLLAIDTVGHSYLL